MGFTSSALRYFSMRRRETKVCSMLIKVSGRALSANFISVNTINPISEPRKMDGQSVIATHYLNVLESEKILILNHDTH